MRLHIKPLYAHNSSTPPLCRAPIHRHKIEMVQRMAIRWTLNYYYSYDSVSQMQTNLGWRSVDQRRVDARLCMLNTIAHCLFAIQQPPLAVRQIHTSVNVYKYAFFPLAVVQWNKLPADVVMLPTRSHFSVAVRSLDHQLT